jgi:O-antigen biosynthesis protein
VAPRVAVISSATGAEFLDWTREWLADLYERTESPGWSLDLVDDGGELRELEEVLGTDYHPVPKVDLIPVAFNLAISVALLRDPDYVLLLTTSTRPSPEAPLWLDKLVGCAENYPEVGIVCTRNVNRADGSLNHAGVAILRNAEGPVMGVHIGRDTEVGTGIEDVERVVEAGTGACLLICRAVLDAGVRFDETFDDSGDLSFCLDARAHGFKTLYCPHVVMLRDEAHTRGQPQYARDLRADRAKFAAKWKGKA